MASQSGLTFDANGRLLITDLLASAVPATAMFHNGFALSASDGSVYCTSNAASSPVIHNGLGYRGDGALYVITVAPNPAFPKGAITTDGNGAVLKAGAGTIANYQNGLPFTSAGALVTSA